MEGNITHPWRNRYSGGFASHDGLDDRLRRKKFSITSIFSGAHRPGGIGQDPGGILQPGIPDAALGIDDQAIPVVGLGLGR